MKTTKEHIKGAAPYIAAANTFNAQLLIILVYILPKVPTEVLAAALGVSTALFNFVLIYIFKGKVQSEKE